MSAQKLEVSRPAFQTASSFSSMPLELASTDIRLLASNIQSERSILHDILFSDATVCPPPNDYAQPAPEWSFILYGLVRSPVLWCAPALLSGWCLLLIHGFLRFA
eukprot:1547798-Pleurochrysis_carterae.AAC.1